MEGGPEGVAVRAGQCGEGWWQWEREGGFRWEGGPGNCTRCLTALDRNKPVSLAFCRAEAEDQAVEVGRWRAGEQPEDELLLHPLDLADWAARQASLRSRLLAAATPGLTAALAELKHAELLHSADPPVTPHSGRRAAVFYLDRGTSGLANLRWWIHAWRDIGLDSEVEKFDLVLLVHPAAIVDLPTDCKLVGFTHCTTVYINTPGGRYSTAHRARAVPLQAVRGDRVPGQHVRLLHEQPGVPGGAGLGVPRRVEHSSVYCII